MIRKGASLVLSALLAASALGSDNTLRQLDLEHCQALLARSFANSALNEGQDTLAPRLRKRLLDRYRRDPFALNIASQIEQLKQFDIEDKSNLFSGNVWFRMVAPKTPGEPYHLVIGIPVIAKLDQAGKPIDLGTKTDPSAIPIKFMAGVMMGVERIERNQQSLDPKKRRNRFKIFQDVTVIAQSVVNQNLARDLTRLGFTHPEKGKLTDAQIKEVISATPPQPDPADPDNIHVEEGVNSLTLALTLPLTHP